MKKVLIAAILLGLVQLVLAESQIQQASAKTGVKNLRKYLCETDPKAAGIEYKASPKVWLPTMLDVNDRYIVLIDVRLKDGKKVTTVMPYGDAVPYWFCRTTVSSGALLCSGKSSMFVFNEKTLRFIDSFFDGYVDGIDDGLNKPYIVVGTCSRL